ncbi:hypothetical protein A2U01_0097773, partial [Trifolium medium]|nr:hypothetical protein [Trifolium medium]
PLDDGALPDAAGREDGEDFVWSISERSLAVVIRLCFAWA